MSNVVAFKHEWRRRYAMAAMQGCIANGWAVTDFIVNRSFHIADEMIAFEEREHEEKVKALRDKET